MEKQTDSKLGKEYVKAVCCHPAVKSLSCVRLFAIPWTTIYQASLSMGFSKQEYWSGLPFPSPGDLPDPGVKPRSPALQTDTLPSEPPGKPIEAVSIYISTNNAREFPFLHTLSSIYCL